MKRSPWFPVWASYQDDEQILALSAEAELLYLRGVARCKQLDQGRDGGQIGRHQLRRLTDKMATDREHLAAELVDAGLWQETPNGWWVKAYGEWNSSAEEERAERAENGKRGNHARWKHKEPFETCTACHPVDNGVSPGESGATPVGVRPDSEPDRQATPQPSLDVDETRCRRDETTPPPPPPTEATPTGAATDPGPVVLADRLIESVGIVGEVANQGERNYVARALVRGWPDQALLDEALEIGGRDDVRDHRAYLLAVLKRYANESPEPAATDPPRPLLHDQRPPCSNAGCVDGWVGGLDDGTGRPGPVERCPDCTGVRA